MKINSDTTKWYNKKKIFLQFGIITIGDGKIHFYWFDVQALHCKNIGKFSYYVIGHFS